LLLYYRATDKDSLLINPQSVLPPVKEEEARRLLALKPNRSEDELFDCEGNCYCGGGGRLMPVMRLAI
jgi:hypothetical protein